MKRAWLSLLAVALGAMVVQVDGTVVAIANPAIAADLGAGLDSISWVTTAYLLILAGFVIPAGTIADKIGFKKAFLIGTGGFSLASLVCGLAGTVELLVGARVLQALFAALLIPGRAGGRPGGVPAREARDGVRGLRRRLGGRDRRRPHPRRHPRRVRELAVGLLRQPPAGRDRGRSSARSSSATSAPGSSSTARHPGCGDAHPGDGRHRVGDQRRADARLGIGPHSRVPRRRDRAARRVRRRRAPDGVPDGAVGPLPQPDASRSGSCWSS